MTCTTCDLCVQRAAGVEPVRLDPMRLVSPADTRPKVRLTKVTLEKVMAALNAGHSPNDTHPKGLLTSEALRCLGAELKDLNANH